jgi:hypothetical protein
MKLLRRLWHWFIGKAPLGCEDWWDGFVECADCSLWVKGRCIVHRKPVKKP